MHNSRQQSVVIGLKMSSKKWYLWQSYIDHIKVSFREFITQVVNAYISLDDTKIEIDRQFLGAIQVRLSQLMLIKGPEKISFRVARKDIKIWDEYCQKHNLTRTNLILMALDAVENRDQEYEMNNGDITFQRLVKVVELMIFTLGEVDYRQLWDMFAGIEHRIFNQALKVIEDQGVIFRKGLSTYVMSNPREKRKATIKLGNLLLRLI